ncbi:DUF2062 domain-containing protein [Pelagicoccus sp. SDUM812002]|uniref:DUF2062 domain-containing protein n=1 Tax=Pelagicoccus sp. SDUM812002 TaxID=3041266 RepID=UPI00280E4E81|nr:DUF2062 domain-containing protein [Pelagicoccus sp. SDUM812002]MDQ8186065.1 DUF2062 domain-containing protein [Pelagicoccus sp. SDUM812002]
MMNTVETETHHDEEHRSRVHSRIRRTKRFLRPLPRRANLHRWPIIKWFAKAARKTPHLWRFGEREVRMAVYVGSIIAFLPIFGAQFAVAFLLALAVRANLLVIMSVQLVTNPITFAPIYLLTKMFGAWLVDLWGLPSLHSGISKGAYEMIIGGLVVGILFGFILDLVFRFFVFRHLNKSVNVKRMLKS